jgi:hypothetical protein
MTMRRLKRILEVLID